ncbi:MAG: hypothetical protein QOE70_6116 [Chthoniobacter sp.]|nr:hypothetical protein [Chthoniobacter sp.]
MKDPTISVVIPSYNRRDGVLALLGDVYRQGGIEFEVIVVDDCSPDGSGDAIADHYPQVKLFRNERNGGPCVARNRGIRAASGEFIVGLDSDVRVPDTNLLARTSQTFADLRANVHCLAFRLLQPDGVSEDKARWWHPVPIGEYAGKWFETSYFSGTGYAFRREPAIAAGLFPEILYMHYEEVELAWRILDNKGTIMHCPNLVVLHHEHQVSRRSEIKTFYKVRSQILLTAGCLPVLPGLTFLAPRIAYAALNAFRGGHLASFARALRSALQLLPARLRQRKTLSETTRKRIAGLRAARARFALS